ncbi:hypothetical protein [Aequorivita sp. CIP111184]|uniref:hypothetical protein n=1 Tax=Aequorivita sp. CIP111184 TaxID=2211356 RepID=UPI000DBC0C8D|nr:hypothetical protein [Aequorivita sp. CIP111184]SRX56206.1 hypothetical protein AEQU1_03236 [Aequorivita sp. CIP111184]
MQEPEFQILDFVINELEKIKLTITPDKSRVVGLDYIITAPTGKIIQLHLRYINLDSDRKIKIQKQDLGNITANQYLGLVLVNENKPILLYAFPSEIISNPDGKIFFSNDVKLLPYLSNWEIKIFIAIIPELAKYEVSNFYLT